MDFKSMIIGGVVGALSSTGFFALNVSAQAPSSANQIVALQKQVSLLSSLDDTTRRDILKVDFRVRDLERKVEGMQKQITILHAKKVNK